MLGPSITGGPPPAKRLSKEPIMGSRTIGGDQPYGTMVQSSMVSAQMMPRHIAQINGKPKIAHMTRTSSGRKQVISWMDAPDDVYFRATDGSK